MPEEDLHNLQEKYADLLENDSDSAPSPEVPTPDKYEHEMLRPETKAERATRWGLGSMLTIFHIYLVGNILYSTISSNEPHMRSFDSFIGLSFVVFFFLCLLYFSVKGAIFYGEKIRLTVTSEELLIYAPRRGYLAGPDPIKLRYPIHKILDASIRNPRSPELNCIMREDKRFKLPKNHSLHSYYLLHPKFLSINSAYSIVA